MWFKGVQVSTCVQTPAWSSVRRGPKIQLKDWRAQILSGGFVYKSRKLFRGILAAASHQLPLSFLGLVLAFAILSGDIWGGGCATAKNWCSFSSTIYVRRAVLLTALTFCWLLSQPFRVCTNYYFWKWPNLFLIYFFPLVLQWQN